MPQPNTRRCAYCRREHPSDQCTHASETLNRPDGTTHIRNTYYCQNCRSYQLAQCVNCCTTVRMNRERNAVYLPNGGGAIAARRTAQGLEYGRYFNSVRRTSDYVCRPCYDSFSFWTCHNCHQQLTEQCGQLPTIDPNTGHKFCSDCARRCQPCVRCNSPYAGDDRRNYANSHRHDHGLLCHACRSTKLISAPDAENPFQMLCGYEIEFVMPTRLADNLKLHDWGIIKYDGSIGDPGGEAGGEWQGWEFNSYPASGSALVTSLYTVIKAIEKAGGIVNRTCGIHFHFDMSQYMSNERTRMVSWWRIFEPVLFDLVPATRRNNRYCGHGANGDRYQALNWRVAYTQHNTFEVRMHHSTLNADEVWDFCKMLLSMFSVLPMTKVPAELGTELRTVHELTKRERAMLLFQQCAMPMSMRKRIVRRINSTNSRQYRVHHWRKPKKPQPPPPATVSAEPAMVAYAEFSNAMMANTTEVYDNQRIAASEALRQLIERHTGRA
jgi:hypothetical protein